MSVEFSEKLTPGTGKKHKGATFINDGTVLAKVTVSVDGSASGETSCAAPPSTNEVGDGESDAAPVSGDTDGAAPGGGRPDV